MPGLLGGECSQPLLVASSGEHGRPLLCQQHGGRAPDAQRRARDHDSCIPKLHHPCTLVIGITRT